MLLSPVSGTTTHEMIDFTMHECGGCGIAFFVPSRWLKRKKEEHGSFYCPNGCNRIFTGKTEADKLKEQLEESERKRAADHENLQNKFLDEMNRANGLEKKLKRVHNGVCPCCNRTFQNLGRHIKTKHPELVKEKPSPNKGQRVSDDF